MMKTGTTKHSIGKKEITIKTHINHHTKLKGREMEKMEEEKRKMKWDL